MASFSKIIQFIDKLQSLPEERKKHIIFTIVGIFAVLIFFWGFKSTFSSISEIEKVITTADISSIKLNDVEQREFGLKLEDNITQSEPSQIPNEVIDPKANWIKYQNQKYNFTIDYPEDWLVNKDKTDNLHLWLEKEISGQVASLHIEVNQNQKIKSAEDGVKYIISNMKETPLEEKIRVGGLDGYEVIGKICTNICKGLLSDPYYPFSVIYFSNGNNIIKVKYAEGKLDEGWNKEASDWKFYNEYKDIISTFKFINNI